MSWPEGWLAESWWVPCALLGAVACWAVVRSYARVPGSWRLRGGLASLKLIGLALLLLSLVEPMRQRAVPRKDANLLLLLVDGSRSLQTHDAAGKETREDRVRRLLDPTSPWQARLEEDFDVRRFVFGERLQAVDEFVGYTADADASELYQALGSLADRFAARPSAGCLLLSDGNATDLPDDLDWTKLPPIYPVIVAERAERDIAVQKVSVSQTNFESAPVTVTAEVVTQGYAGRSLVVRLQAEGKREVARQVVARVEDGRPFVVRFEVRPEKRGVHFYEVQVWDAAGPELEADDHGGDGETEATLENNRYPLVVDRGQGPFRILYVSGRPNWELKFLRRALEEDDQVELSSLVRIARKEPKFSFRSREDGSTNPLFRGFAPSDSEQTEQYDEPVLVSLAANEEQAEVLRRGFPKSAEEMFAYQALVLDDIEANFFDQETQALIEQFVSDRGGTLLMLGGAESFAAGGYDRTRIGGMLPIYLDSPNQSGRNGDYRWQLTREGWLQEWVRLQPTEPLERRRLEGMPPFQTLNRSGNVKPGASRLVEVVDGRGALQPALVVQRFGRGRSAALLLGDLWRWQLRDAPDEDLLKSWRQTARWLVSDVPSRLETQIDQANLEQLRLNVQVRDPKFQPLDNCQVRVAIRPLLAESQPAADSSGTSVQGSAPPAIEVPCEPADEMPGLYRAEFAPREPGAYRVEVVATGPDGTEIARRETGWVQRRQAAEFQSLNANRQVLEDLARQTGGRLIAADDLPQFAQSIPANASMVTETRVEPWWHQWPLFLTAIACLVTEWGVRRWRGLP